MEEISIKKAIADYRDIYLAYRNFAKRTRIEYVNDLEDLAEYLEKSGVHQVGEITLPHLVHYVAELENRGFTGSTRKRKTISIRSFTSFLNMEGYILTDFGKRLIPPFVESRKPRYLSQIEQRDLLECAKSNKRDYAIIQLLLETGIKLSELTGLTVQDLQKTSPNNKTGEEIHYVRVLGNRNSKGRVVPLSQVAIEAIDDYLIDRGISNSDCLFLNKSGKQLGKRGVEKVIGKYLELAGIKNANVNSLRHTFGTRMATKGTDQKVTQQVMGHQDRRTTEIYFRVANETGLF